MHPWWLLVMLLTLAPAWVPSNAHTIIASRHHHLAPHQDQRSPPPPPRREVLCLLPLGDSLTQGVGKHGSYRPVLETLIHQRAPHVSVLYGGTSNRTCTPKKPNVIFQGDSYDLPHEGHCSWNSRQLYELLKQKLIDNKQGMLEYARSCRGTREVGEPTLEELRVDSGGGNGAERSFTIDVVLLLIGHNDAFQAARHCRAIEAPPLDPKQHHASDGSEHMLLYSSTARCVTTFLQEYETNLQNILSLLISAFPLVKIIVGLNPTTRFPVVDAVLHQVILSVVGEYGQGQTGTVAFDGWNRDSTFDSTHPNAAGNLIMAEAWWRGMRRLPVPQLISPTDKKERRAAEEEELDLKQLSYEDGKKMMMPHLKDGRIMLSVDEIENIIAAQNKNVEEEKGVPSLSMVAGIFGVTLIGVVVAVTAGKKVRQAVKLLMLWASQRRSGS